MMSKLTPSLIKWWTGHSHSYPDSALSKQHFFAEPCNLCPRHKYIWFYIIASWTCDIGSRWMECNEKRLRREKSSTYQVKEYRNKAKSRHQKHINFLIKLSTKTKIAWWEITTRPDGLPHVNFHVLTSQLFDEMCRISKTRLVPHLNIFVRWKLNLPEGGGQDTWMWLGD
jgi:hypothetical protein